MGLTLPFLLVYLHEQRGIGLGAAGLIVASIGLAGFVGNPVGGWLCDVVGARRVAVAGLLVVAVGAALTPAVRSTWQGFLAAGTYGLGIALAAPARGALLALVVPVPLRGRAFALRYGLNNLGQTLGGLIGALLVVASPGGFTAIYLVEAVTFLLFALLTVRVRPRTNEPVGRSPGGYRQVVGDRPTRAVLALIVLVVAAGYGQHSAGFTGYATEGAGVDAAGLGLAFAVSTLVVVVAQLPVNGWSARIPRSRTMAAAAFTTALGWAVALVGGAVSDSVWPFVVAMGLFGLGATAFSPVVAALVNDLATDDLRGRYNAAFNLTYTIGFTAGPALAALFLSAGYPAAPLTVAVVVLLGAVLLSLRLGRLLPASVNLPAVQNHRGTQ